MYWTWGIDLINRIDGGYWPGNYLHAVDHAAVGSDQVKAWCAGYLIEDLLNRDTPPHIVLQSCLQFSQQGPGEFIDYNSHAAGFNSKADEEEENISLRNLLLLIYFLWTYWYENYYLIIIKLNRLRVVHYYFSFDVDPYSSHCAFSEIIRFHFRRPWNHDKMTKKQEA